MADPNAHPYDAYLAAPLAWGAGMVKNNQAVANAARGMVNSAVSGATLPGDVATGRVDPMSDEGVRRTQDLAGTMMGGGMAASDAPKGATGMFIGMKSPLFNRDRFRGAMELQSASASPEEIWHKTQNMQIPGGHWAQEIPDNISSFDVRQLPHAKSFSDYMDVARREHGTADLGHQVSVARALQAFDGPPKAAPLGQVMRHEGGLMDAYQGMPELPVSRSFDPRYAGHFDPNTMSMRVNPKAGNPAEHRATALHELQHYVQELEGWPKGGNEEMFHFDPWKDRMLPHETPAQAYERLAGEQLANATAGRRDLAGYQRAERYPGRDMTAPMDMQLIRRTR